MIPHVVKAQESVPAQECCSELLIPIGARTVGLGQALTARAGLDAGFINPAALTDIAKSELVFHRSTAGNAAVSTFLVILHTKVAGNFALSYTAMDFGTDTSTSTTGEVTGTLSTPRASLIASYATKVGLGWSAGLNLRLFYAGLQCTGSCPDNVKSGTTNMLDAGVRYVPTWLPRLNLGASVMQAGFPLQVNNAAQANPTPVRVRVGGAYDVSRMFTKDSTVEAWLNVDVVERIREAGSPAVNVGIEVILDKTIYLRGGHASAANGVTTGGNAVGLGLKYQRFDIDLAKAASSSPLFEDPVYVSFGISF